MDKILKWSIGPPANQQDSECLKKTKKEQGNNVVDPAMVFQFILERPRLEITMKFDLKNKGGNTRKGKGGTLLSCAMP